MNLRGYRELDDVLVIAGVDATIRLPMIGEDLRFFTVDIQVERSSDEPMADVSDVLNAFVASGHLRRDESRTMDINYSPALEIVGFTEFGILFEDTNAEPPGSVEVR